MSKLANKGFTKVELFWNILAKGRFDYIFAELFYAALFCFLRHTVAAKF